MKTSAVRQLCRDHQAARIISLSLLVGLSACDPIYGIAARTATPVPPDESCIIASLRQTPGVDNVSEQTRTDGSYLIAGNGPTHGTPTKYFSYRVGPDPMQTATFWVEKHADGKYYYSDIMLSMHERIPKEQIYQAYPVMVRAVNQISQLCHLDIAKAMHHACLGYDCATESVAVSR
jgi:hypothetical protein